MADQDIEKKLRNRLGYYEEEPAPSAWQEIERGLKPTISTWPVQTLIVGSLLIGLGSYIYWDELNTWVLAEEIAPKNTQEIRSNPEIPDQTIVGNSNDVSITQQPGIVAHKLDSEKTCSVQNNNKRNVLGNVLSSPTDDQGASSFQGKQAISPKDKPIIGSDPLSQHYNRKKIIETDVKEKKQGIKDDPLEYAQLSLLNKISPELISFSPKEIRMEGVDRKSRYPCPEREKNERDWTEKRTSYYFLGMPTLNFNRIEANPNDNQLITKIKNIPAVSSERIGVRLESGLTYQVTPRFSLLLGLLYFDRRQQIDYVVSVLDSLTGQRSGNEIILEPGFTEESRSYDYHVRNIGTQIGFTYSIPSDKFETYVGTGIEFHKSIRSQVDSSFEEPEFYVFYNLLYRIEYPKDKRFRFLVQPTFNYSLDLSKELNTPIFVKPYGFGLNLGFSIKL
ncbi:MAG: hypothetical protein AAF693_11430 [Bacteroidota bacterium]